jgi:hypothetical protein
MFADIRTLSQIRAGFPHIFESLIFHEDDFVACMSAEGATPDTFLDCKTSWCSDNAWKNHER